ncbi:MAG: DUF3037 domain-containing protein [Steroidobacteraceae bacterium]
MHDHCSYDYAIVRVVPRVERQEFINIGAIVSCPTKNFLEARIELDEARLKAFDATLDIEAIRLHANSILAICAGGPDSGPIGKLTQRERFHWLIAPRSTVIQMSPGHSGRCAEPNAALEHLLEKMVRPIRNVKS